MSALCLLGVGCGDGEGHKHAVECRTDDDCDPSTLGVCDTVSCVAERCELGTRPNGHRCDDADPLTGEDACVDGICAGVTKACEDDLGPCLKAVHDEATDECTVEPVEDGAACDDADACTQVDACQAGECVGGEAKACEASDDCHVAGSCDPKTGECSDEAAEDGAPCDDDQACTTDDACTDGACLGEAVVCDDGLACSADSCDETSGACAADMSKCSCVTDADCDDGNACNGTELCDPEQKLCQLGTPVVCGATGDPCLAGVCVPETGACEPEQVLDGTVCDDGSACTARDTCQSGQCTGSDAVVCTALSQCHAAGKCNKLTGACTNPEKATGSSCNDADACTLVDTCQMGACVGGSPVTCVASDQCHEAGVCDSARGVCSKPAKQDGVKCDDANPCSTGDACQNGACVPSGQVKCTALDGCHLVGTCDTTSGKCTNPLKADGTTCNDGLTCKTGDVCTNGKCQGQAVVCNDGVDCTVDSCSEQLGGCTTDPKPCPCTSNAQCNDGNPCNGVETCQAFKCLPGTAVNCAGLDDLCNVGQCDPSGKCVATPKADGTTCDDADKCSAASSCQAGKCKGTELVSCDALDTCHTAGTCNPGTGLCSNPVKADGAACSDNDECTKTDSCKAGVCTGPATVCSASDDCHTAGTCNPATGKCSSPIKANGTGCDDGIPCTSSDTCQGGICSGSPVVCKASDQCHDIGSCDPLKGTCSNPNKLDGTLCNDGKTCTNGDKCTSGACGGASIRCDDKVACTVDTCVEPSGCSFDTSKCECTSDAKCNDNDACNGVETCDLATFTCKSGTPHANVDGDWSDDPGGQKLSSNGPTSVDIFTDKAENANVVGTYPRDIAFNDKDGTPQQTLKAVKTQALGIYWAKYSEAGDVKQPPLNIGGATLDVQGLAGNIGVADAAGHLDGSFTLLGLFNGTVEFGLQGNVQARSSATTAAYVAHYKATGDIAWVAVFSPANDKTSIGVGGVAAYDDGSVIAIGGSTNGGVSFADVTGKETGSTKQPGIWAARLDAKGNLKWAEIVVYPDATAAAAAVTTHEDGSASLTGAFTGTAKLGPNGEVSVSPSAAEGKTAGDIWFQKLDPNGAIAFGGRVGGTGRDLPGDVERIKGGGMLLLANTLGNLPNVDDATKTQPLHATASSGVQTHVLGFDKSGSLLTDGLIANSEAGATRGYELHVDQNGLYAVAGVFQSSTSFYGSVGLGSGPPSTGVNFQVASLHQGPTTLYAARVDASSRFGWAVQAGGDSSGMVTAPWDVVMTAHPSHSLTIAGIFNAAATFGDQKPELLQGDAKLGNAFVVHLNSEAEYDYCK